MELNARERFYIQNNECLNKFIPGRTSKEYYQDNKEIKKDYYEDNKADILSKQKVYYGTIKKEKLIYLKEYRRHNKEILNKKCTCACGGKFTYGNKSTHYKALKHKKYLDSL
jgi:hypothetical protein